MVEMTMESRLQFHSIWGSPNTRAMALASITPENDALDLEGVPFTVLSDPTRSVFRKPNALSVGTTTRNVYI
jgi:hypothetical protein